jgi:undecaprenyl diphosphate synthase
MNSKIPEHVAIIPDGNRRWAKAKGLVKTEGHLRSGTYSNLNPLLEEAEKLGVKCVSLWGFSTENWKRSRKEIDTILGLVSKGINDFSANAKERNICFKHVGRKEKLPRDLVKKLEKLERDTEKCNGIALLLCVDYGGRNEIVRAVKKMIENKEKNINEYTFSSYLDTSGFPEPDLIVRTGGEKRLSGFMPYQSVYSEIYFTDVLFPDFDKKELRKAIKEFSKRQRRFGE